MVETEISFGDYLKELIKEAGMSQTEFYHKLGIKKPYFYDIVSGRTNPPPHNLQIKAMTILHVDQSEQAKFYDLAAKGRGDMPADISKWVSDNPSATSNIRRVMREKGEKS